MSSSSEQDILCPSLWQYLMWTSQDVAVPEWGIEIYQNSRSFFLCTVEGISSWNRGHSGSLAGSNILLCQHKPSRLMSKGWALRTKGSHLVHPCKQVTKAERKAQHTCGCMWLYWLFNFPSVMWPSYFNSLSFISLLCHPFPCLVRTQPVSFWALLPAKIQVVGVQTPEAYGDSTYNEKTCLVGHLCNKNKPKA
jgi:hypothetical protein